MSVRHVTHGPEETIAVGRELAELLQPGIIVLLTGDLGAGKTTLVKGIAGGFSAARADDVTSPTFTLVHEYRGANVLLYHIDLYRIETAKELATLGLEDLQAANAILLIEWGDKFEPVRAAAHFAITIRTLGVDDREIVCERKK